MRRARLQIQEKLTETQLQCWSNKPINRKAFRFAEGTAVCFAIRNVPLFLRQMKLNFNRVEASLDQRANCLAFWVTRSSQGAPLFTDQIA